MLKTLIKKQFTELFQTYFVNKKTGKARSKKGTVLLFVFLGFLFLALGFAFYMMANGIGKAILGGDLNWLYFALMGLIAMALGVFGSVFNTYASVYLPKDNELLISLPIPTKTLLLARLFGVYLTSFMYSAWVWIPTIIAYYVIVPVNVFSVIFTILMTFVIGTFVAILSCILGWVVALISAKTKGKSFITLLLSLAVFILYYFVYFKMINSIEEVIAHIGEIGNTVKTWLHYLYFLGKGADGDALSMLIVTVITATLAVVCIFVLSKTFLKLSTVSVSDGKKSKAPEGYSKRSIKSALVRREFKHFTSVSTWMLNGGFGLMLLPVIAVVVLIKSGDIREFLPVIISEFSVFYELLPLLLAVAVCFILSVSAILPVSVSMEGKTLWQLQSLPVKSLDILHAKESMSVQLCTYPSVLFIIICGIVFSLSWWEIALAIVAVLGYILVISDFGLFLNLKMPNFSWDNVASLTKQSAPVVISMFSGWIFCAVICVGSFYLSKIVASWIILIGFILLLYVLYFILNKWLKTKGVEIFESL